MRLYDIPSGNIVSETALILFVFFCIYDIMQFLFLEIAEGWLAISVIFFN